ncbi:hemerythrin domain-containing protein [Acrocarpospora sp. B8E8]|uniref:hemerythrin domain-containing protein n=1 Tax=Acrocarpospora sp. B8E8 TaxID=3153572 RepID=UPI00325D77B6
MSTATQDHPYVQEMVIIHRVFRRESRLLPRVVGRVAAGDAARAKVVAEYYRAYAEGLHHHHTNEDNLLWPKLLARVDLEAELVLRMEAQHEVVAGTMERIAALLPEWERTAALHLRDQIIAELGRHRDALVEHLGEEEERILPLISEHITVAEWNALGEQAFREMANDSATKKLISLGSILEEITSEEYAHFMADKPVMVKLIWNLVGKRVYAKQIKLIRG